MNRKKTFFSILLVGFMVVSLLTANLTKGILVTDQLEIPDGTYTEGKLLYSDGVSTFDLLIGYATIEVDRIFTFTDIPDKIMQVTLAIERVDPIYDHIDYLLNETNDEMTFYVFYDNRTTFHMPRLFFANDTESIEYSLLAETTYEGLMDFNNTVVSWKNGTSYKLGDPSNPTQVYFVLGCMMGAFTSYGNHFLSLFTWTIFGISPTANIGDDINYEGTYGEVIGKPAVIASNEKSYDTIMVRYYFTAVMGFWVAEVDVYYEAATGFPLRIMEKVGSEHVEFVPGEFKKGSGIPFSTTGIILGLVAFGIITIIRRKKK
jgi:hypothetical protein